MCYFLHLRMQLIRLFGTVLLLLSVNAIGDAEAWRGIVPLHSTRADVELLLGQPPAPPTDGTRIDSLNKGRSIYFTDEGEVYVVYANDFFGDKAISGCLKKVPLDTVLFLSVEPKNGPKVGFLKLDLHKFKHSTHLVPRTLVTKRTLMRKRVCLLGPSKEPLT